MPTFRILIVSVSSLESKDGSDFYIKLGWCEPTNKLRKEHFKTKAVKKAHHDAVWSEAFELEVAGPLFTDFKLEVWSKHTLKDDEIGRVLLRSERITGELQRGTVMDKLNLETEKSSKPLPSAITIEWSYTKTGLQVPARLADGVEADLEVDVEEDLAKDSLRRTDEHKTYRADVDDIMKRLEIEDASLPAIQLSSSEEKFHAVLVVIAKHMSDGFALTRLYSTGSRMVHRALRLNVEKFVLALNPRHQMNHWPQSVLGCLRHVKHIEVGYTGGFSRAKQVSIVDADIKALPPALEVLIVQLNTSLPDSSFARLPRTLTKLSCNTTIPGTNYGDLPRGLRSFRALGLKMASEATTKLPRSLLEFCLDNSNSSEVVPVVDDDLKAFQGLPRGLLELRWQFGITNAAIKALPRLLHTFSSLMLPTNKMDALSDSTVPFLPRTLTSLTLFNDVHLGKNGLRYLPRGLEHLSLPKAVLLNTNSLDQLPPHLSTLNFQDAIYLLPPFFNKIPQSITSLAFSGTQRREEMGKLNFPPKLQHLTISYARRVMDSFIDDLPGTLRSLTLESVSDLTPAVIQKLPRSLTSLRITVAVVGHFSDATWGALPAGLVHLTMSGSSVTITQEGLCKLPRSLTELFIHSFQPLKIVDSAIDNAFPPNLVSLSLPLNNISIDGFKKLPKSLQHIETCSDLQPGYTALELSSVFPHLQSALVVCHLPNDKKVDEWKL